MKVISVADRNAWLKSKIYMIRMIIVDEIVVRKRIVMRVFAFGKLACEYFPTYLEMARKLAVEDASAILGTTVKYDILFPSEKTGELPLVGGKIKCGNTELQHVCMADTFMSLDHRARLDGAIEFVCKGLLAGNRVTYFLSLCSRYGNYSESELRELRKDQWANRSDEYKQQRSENEKRRWDERTEEYKQQHSEDVKRRRLDERKLSSGSTEEAIYYAIDGADENGKYILLEEKFGTNDKTFRKKVKIATGKKNTKQFYTMEAIEEFYLKRALPIRASQKRTALA